MPKKPKHLLRLATHTFWSEHRRAIAGSLGILLFTIGIFFVQLDTRDYAASVLGIRQAPAFDGTSVPIAEVPNWRRLSTGEGKLLAAQIPTTKLIALPNYDPAIFGAQLASLSTTDETLWNQLVTYATPYMGSYESPSREYQGSHLAVDIKTPTGTKVFAIANGEVVKVAEQSSGFGKHLVIKHENVPGLDGNTTNTFYSSYSHLSQILVKQGDVLTRGTLIAESGDTGTSTTPHLHFQLDNSNAPWHPWWPFSMAQAAAAGLDFFGGVSSGLGQAEAITNTIHPMLWVQRHLTTTPVSTDLHATAATSTTPAPATTPTPTTATTTSTTTAPAQPTPAPASNTAAASYRFRFGGDSFAFVGNTAEIQITALTESGAVDTSFTPANPIKLNVTGGSVSPERLTASDFVSGVARVQIQQTVAGKVTLAAADTSSAYDLTFVDQIAMIARFSLVPPSGFAQGVPQTITIQALDTNDNPTPNGSIAGTVKLTTSTGLGTFTPTTLSASDFVQGKASFQLSYDSPEPFRIKAQEGALVGESEIIYPQIFSDVSASHPNAKAITYLKDKKIIGGYPDGSFQPAKTVNRAEALKMLELGLGVDCSGPSSASFPDVSREAWFVEFVSCALANGIASGYPDGTFGPGKTINRAEYLKILLGSAKVEATPATESPYADVGLDAWFAGFASYAKAKNVLPVSGSTLEPSQGMTRAEVAETIYRMLVLRQTGAASYSADLAVE